MSDPTKLETLLTQYLESAINTDSVPTFPTQNSALAYVALETVRLMVAQPENANLLVDWAVVEVLNRLQQQMDYAEQQRGG
jgi:hypothetical protein